MVSHKANRAIKLGAASLVAMMALAPVGQLLAQDPALAAVAPAKGNADNGKAIFESSACSACHVLEAAGSVGEVGPKLDHNPNLTHDLIVSRVANGQGAMPPYAGQLSEAEIEDVTAYILVSAAK